MRLCGLEAFHNITRRPSGRVRICYLRGSMNRSVYFEIDSNKRSGAADVMRHPAIKRSAFAVVACERFGLCRTITGCGSLLAKRKEQDAWHPRTWHEPHPSIATNRCVISPGKPRPG